MPVGMVVDQPVAEPQDALEPQVPLEVGLDHLA
jgi:hypothetical protein